MDNQRSEKIMEEYREEVSDLRRQSYPKMSLNEAVKIASEYMLNHYSKEELKEAIINDKQMQLFGMEKSWLNALGKAKKMAKGSTIEGLKVGDNVSTPKFNNGKILKIHTFNEDEDIQGKLLKKGQGLFVVQNLDINTKSDLYWFFSFELTKKMAKGSTVEGGEIRRFDRHANMGGETRGQILNYTNYPIIYNDMDKYERINEALKKEGFSKSRFSNYLYGLFDGYDYSDTDTFKEQMAIIKKVDAEFYKKISSIYEEIRSYPEVKYAKGSTIEGGGDNVNLNENSIYSADIEKQLGYKEWIFKLKNTKSYDTQLDFSIKYGLNLRSQSKKSKYDKLGNSNEYFYQVYHPSKSKFDVDSVYDKITFNISLNYLEFDHISSELKNFKRDTLEVLQIIKKIIDGQKSTMAKDKYAKGSTVKGNYFSELEANFSSTRRGGVKNYSVDIDLENGEQLRGGDLDFKDGNDALFLYERVKQKGEYRHEKIEDIQLIVNFKNGDYETVDIPTYANGGGVDENKITEQSFNKYKNEFDFYTDDEGDVIRITSNDKELLDKIEKDYSDRISHREYNEWIEVYKNISYSNGGIMSSGFNYSIGGL